MSTLTTMRRDPARVRWLSRIVGPCTSGAASWSMRSDVAVQSGLDAHSPTIAVFTSTKELRLKELVALRSCERRVMERE